MRTVNIKGTRVDLFDAAEETPVTRYIKFNEYIAIEAGIGSDLDAYDSKLKDLITMIDRGDKQSAKQAVLNMRQTIQFVVENVSPKSLAFASMIYRIGGESVEMLSDEDRKEIIEKLSNRGLSMQMLAETVFFIKKKLRTSWMSISRVFSRGEVKLNTIPT